MTGNNSIVTLTTYHAWNGRKWVEQPPPPVRETTGEGWVPVPRCVKCGVNIEAAGCVDADGPQCPRCYARKTQTTYCTPSLSVAAWVDARTPHDRLEARVDQLGADVAALQRTIARLELRSSQTTAAPHKHRWLGYMEGREICLDCDLVREV